MTADALARTWGTTPARICRWCRLDLLPAVRTSRDWRIEPSARPPYRDGRMICCWLPAAVTSALVEKS